MQCNKCGTFVQDGAFCPACGNQLNTMNQPMNNNQVNQNNVGTITVFRIKQFKGALIPFHVYIDNVYIGDVKSEVTLPYNVYYGHHQVVFKSTEKDVIQEVDINEFTPRVTITVEAKFGLIAAKPSIISVTNN